MYSGQLEPWLNKPYWGNWEDVVLGGCGSSEHKLNMLISRLPKKVRSESTGMLYYPPQREMRGLYISISTGLTYLYWGTTYTVVSGPSEQDAIWDVETATVTISVTVTTHLVCIQIYDGGSGDSLHPLKQKLGQTNRQTGRRWTNKPNKNKQTETGEETYYSLPYLYLTCHLPVMYFI